MNLNHATNKQTGSALSAEEWNSLAADVNELGSGGAVSGGVVSTEVDQLDSNKTFVKVGNVLVGELTSKGDKGTNVGISGDNNINIEPRPAAGTGEGKNTPGLANRKGGNIALKPGDDIEFWGHKRGTSKNDEVSVKIMTEVPKASDPTKTDEVAAKLQLNAGDIVLTSKDKQEDSDVMNITVNKAANTRGYLKVRAQAIDLRCEDHGGIALQPKGEDGEGHENKIKFEHDGGDGKEFGTFNTDKTSIFTNEYRFNKDGIIYAVTRGPLVTTYKVEGDPNSGIKKIDYPTQADDFKDIISQQLSCTWEDVVEYVNWAKDNFEGPFTLTRFLNKQIESSRDENGKITLYFPKVTSHDIDIYPGTVQDFIDNVIYIKGRQVDNLGVYGPEYTLTPTASEDTHIVLLVPSIQDANPSEFSFGIHAVASPQGSYHQTVLIQQDTDWYITEIKYNDNPNSQS